ncbi:MAG: chemotaxis protein CheA, partial [Pseudomonadota bacterium]
NLPAIDALSPEESYLVWNVEVSTEAPEGDLHEIFEFVEGDCELSIEQTGDSSITQTADAVDGQSDDIDDSANIEESGAAIVGDDSVEPASTPDEARSDPDVPNEKIDLPPPSDSSEDAREAKTPSPKAPPKKATTTKENSGPKATVRVDLERVDRLINLVGELVINQAMLSECVSEADLTTDTAVSTGLEEFKQLTREIQESVMAIRAQPVKSLFQRMSRIVREASEATGKSVQLTVEGEATEVDKTVVERLAEPLTHMIRNAVDHGLETPEKRLETGKEERGTVFLTAAHKSGRVVIEVSDDGAGINRERVRQIAIDKGLIAPDLELTNTEIDNLLFMPGFSTAKEVSDLSGRGVGMDVVKRSIQALGGRISISSTPGQGTAFSISLPLTLAVLDGMVVTVAGQTLVAPLTSIVETLTPNKSDIHFICDGAATILIRGSFVPIIDVGAQLGYRDRIEELSECVILLVETDEGVRCALAVDTIQDQRQVVIKGLEHNYGHVPGIAAATILGDGRIALILDADALVQESSMPKHVDQNLQLAG